MGTLTFPNPTSVATTGPIVGASGLAAYVMSKFCFCPLICIRGAPRVSPLGDGAFVPWSQLCPVSDYLCKRLRFYGPNIHQTYKSEEPVSTMTFTSWPLTFAVTHQYSPPVSLVVWTLAAWAPARGRITLPAGSWEIGSPPMVGRAGLYENHCRHETMLHLREDRIINSEWRRKVALQCVDYKERIGIEDEEQYEMIQEPPSSRPLYHWYPQSRTMRSQHNMEVADNGIVLGPKWDQGSQSFKPCVLGLKPNWTACRRP